MQSSSNVPWWQVLLPLVVVVGVLAFRLIRPQRISVTRLWIQPLMLVAVTGFAIYASEAVNPAPGWEVAVAMLVGAAVGVPLGILRGTHTDVRPTERRGVMYLGSSWITIAIFLVAFGLRSAVRLAMPAHGSLSSAIGDGLLALAIAFIAASYVVIYRKYELELAGRLAAPPAPPEVANPG